MPHTVQGTSAGRVFHKSRIPCCSLSLAWSRVPMESTGRFFLCARCREQVVICRHCDRGQTYCSGSCSQSSRRAAIREAGRRYQSSHRGRLKHAQRARCYRARQNNKVTHQGSLAPVADALLMANKTAAVEGLAQSASSKPESSAVSKPDCHFCHRPRAIAVRIGFLRRRGPSHHRHPDRRGN